MTIIVGGSPRIESVAKTIAKEEVEGAFGWAQYSDGQYTSTSPLEVGVGVTVLLTNNALSTIKSQLPTGVTDFYDSVTNTITPDTLGDGYIVRINMKTHSTSNTGYGELYIDIGDGVTPIKIIELPVTFPRGTGLVNVRPYTSSSFVFALDTFITNGGKIYYESVRGNTSIYDIVFLIERTSKGK